MSNRNAIRRHMRSRRREVPTADRKLAARAFAAIADRAHLLRPSRRIAAYLPYGHEADTSVLIERALERGCIVYVPVITHRRAFRMEFARFDSSARLRNNLFGIDEPIYSPSTRIAPLHLDVIFLPLVAFDQRGWRLGSGAGFYDRRLHYLLPSRTWRRPKLIGIAYSCQESALQPDRWDVPMDAVITESALLRFNASKPESNS